MKRLGLCTVISSFIALTIVASVPSVAGARGSGGAHAATDSQIWLCAPTVRTATNPCLSSENVTAVAADGSTSVQTWNPAPHPKIDCFYVYPTVSTQTTLNANLKIEAAERNVAVDQASLFSHVCRVFAPMYPQITTTGLFERGGGLSIQGTSKGQKVAYAGLLRAWKDYLARYNKGRGVVLIGHSQGTYLLRELISKTIDDNNPIRHHVVSAILLGGNVLVPQSKSIGGDFKHLGACTSASALHCVIAYSSFLTPPPVDSFFGRTTAPGDQVLCTNPAGLIGDGTALTPYFLTPIDGVSATAWATFPGLLTGQCETGGGATWLNITETLLPGDPRPVLKQTLGPQWGLHLYDVNLELGNLVGIVQHEAAAYPGP